MLRNIFARTLRAQWKSLAWWSAGLATLGFFMAMIYPSMKGMPELNRLIESMPQPLIRAFVGQLSDFTSPAGFLSSELYYFMVPLMFLFYAVEQGAQATAREEEQGTLDVLLSTPTPRWQVVVGKYGASICGTLLLGLMIWVGVILGGVLAGADFPLGGVAAATLSAVLLALAFAAWALALGALTGSVKLASGVMAAYAICDYFRNALGPMVGLLKPYQKFCMFYYYLGADPINNGLKLLHVLVLLGVAACGVALAVWAFQRRDVRV